MLTLSCHLVAVGIFTIGLKRLVSEEGNLLYTFLLGRCEGHLGLMEPQVEAAVWYIAVTCQKKAFSEPHLPQSIHCIPEEWKTAKV